jgi:hypothetical protein
MATDEEFLQKILNATAKPEPKKEQIKVDFLGQMSTPERLAQRAQNNPVFTTTRQYNIDDHSFSLEQSSINFGQTPSRHNLTQPTPLHSGSDPGPKVDMQTKFPGLHPTNKARSLDSDITTQGSLTREMRNELKGKDLAQFIDKATLPLGVKFELPLISQSDPAVSASILLDSTYSFVSKVEHLILRLKNYAMDDVFMIVETLQVSNPFTNTNDATTDVVIDTTVESIGLLSNYSKLTAAKVKLSCQAYFQYGDKVAIDNLMWSQNLILRSCSEALANTLNARLSILPPYQRGGPTVFMLLAELMLSSTDKTSNNILNKLQYVRLSHYNENVEQAVAVLYANVQRLEACNKLPPNINYTLINILQTSSVFAFRSHFATLHSMDDPRVQDPHKMLHEAVVRYRILKDDDRWNPVVNSKQQSTFVATSGSASPAVSVSASPQSATTLKTHDFLGNPIDRTPPSHDESKTRMNSSKGREEMWCAECGRWGSHLDAGHLDFKNRFKTFRSNNRGGPNQAHPVRGGRGGRGGGLSQMVRSSPSIDDNDDDQSGMVTELIRNTSSAQQDSQRLRIPQLPTTNFTMGNF